MTIPGIRDVMHALLSVLAPGADARIAAEIAARALVARAGTPVLDVGCGPTSRLARLGIRPVGVDRSVRTLRFAEATCGGRVRADASALPFASATFGSAWCFGLLHHLDDAAALRALREMRRVTRPGGLLVVFDGVLPASRWRRPVAAVIRALDRGRHMRSEAALRDLLGSATPLTGRRFGYAATGLEGLLAFGVVDDDGRAHS